MQKSSQGAIALPLLEATMAGLVRRVAVGQIVPGSPGAEDLENPVQHRAGILPRSPAGIGASLRFQQRPQDSPLGIGEVHALI